MPNSHEFKYISDGCMYEYSDGRSREIRSEILAEYKAKMASAAERNEWKHTGEGAQFMGAYRHSSSPADVLASIYSRVSCIGEHNGQLIYSLAINSTEGIYRKHLDRGSEGIVLCNGNLKYGCFDILGDRMAVAGELGGECHISVMDIPTKNIITYTEGRTADSEPFWSRVEKDKIYFSSKGLSENTNPPSRELGDEEMSYGQMATQMFAARANSSYYGPNSICLIDISTGSLEEILSDPAYSFVHPKSTSDGSLYYVKRPYKHSAGSNTLGCLTDIVLFPFRLLGAVFDFLNVFTAKYSGKTLSHSDVKQRDEKNVIIEGNLINAERELRENSKRGEKNPGIIPRSWELRRLLPNGEDVLVKPGVSAFAVKENGDIIYSNGSHIILLAPDGREERLLSARGVSFIL